MNTSAFSGATMIIYSGLLGNLLLIPAIIIATTAHEAIRALVSTLLGDPTPKKEGRLTANPLKHFEPIGFLLMYATALMNFIGCGWGLPVNTNPRHYANRRPGVVLTALLPSVGNFLIALISSYAMKYLPQTQPLLYLFFAALQWMNLSLVVCNLLPVSPFDCLKVIMELVSRKNYFALSQIESVAQLIMMLLLFSRVLNLVLSPIYKGLFFLVSLLTF